MLDDLALRLSVHTPSTIITCHIPNEASLVEARSITERTRSRMVAVQEELDWETYRLYGLITEDLTYSLGRLPDLAPSERAFAIALARSQETGESDTTWFIHHNHNYLHVVDIPEHWPQAYRDLVQRRLDLIASNPSIRLLERPEYKRRWAQEPWEKRQERALRGWLLDRVEDKRSGLMRRGGRCRAAWPSWRMR